MELTPTIYGGLEWKETARWIKYEEDVEGVNSRWGKPHIACLSFQALFALRKLFSKGEIVPLVANMHIYMHTDTYVYCYGKIHRRKEENKKIKLILPLSLYFPKYLCISHEIITENILSGTIDD